MSNTFALLFSIDLVMLAFFMYLPVMRGEDAFFGVRVSPEVYRTEGRRILRRYWFWLLMTFVEIEVIGLLVSFYKGRTEFAQVAPRMLLMPCVMLFYVIFYKQAKKFEFIEEQGRFASALRTRHLSDYTSLALEVTVVTLTIAPVLVLVYYYPQLPTRIPTHWNWRGLPDRWTEKSYFAVFSLAATLVYMQGLLFFIKHGLLGVKMTLPAEHTEEYLKLKEEMLGQTVKLMDRMRLCLCVLFGGITSNIAFSSIERLYFLSSIVAVAVWVSTMMILLSVTVAIYRFYGIDSRLKAEVGRVYVQRKQDAAHWYLGGLVYCNKEDPALFVEKLVGWGYTFNMANKWVYLYLAVMIAVPLLLILPLDR